LSCYITHWPGRTRLDCTVLGEAGTEAAHPIPRPIANDVQRQLRANSGR
jgi:hypothetical protein